MEKFLIRSDQKVKGKHLKNKDFIGSQSVSLNQNCKSGIVDDLLPAMNAPGNHEWKKDEEEGKNQMEEMMNDSHLQPKKRICLGDKMSDSNIDLLSYNWRIISAESLNLKYARIFSKVTSDYIFSKLEEEVEYFTGDLLKVRVFGKWHNIPRKQVSFGDPGLSYKFSGNCVPAVPWSKCNIVHQLKNLVELVCQQSFNFVLVNRYKDGKDHMGEHRDDEKDLVSTAPIASLSFGQARDFIFKHKDARGVKSVRNIKPVKLVLEHGSLLLMLHPTNKFWYHSLPVRSTAPNIIETLSERIECIKTNYILIHSHENVSSHTYPS